jgi:TolA-binding protein
VDNTLQLVTQMQSQRKELEGKIERLQEENQKLNELKIDGMNEKR